MPRAKKRRPTGRIAPPLRVGKSSYTLSDAFIFDLSQLLESGLAVESACRLLGVHINAFTKWMDAGRNEELRLADLIEAGQDISEQPPNLAHILYTRVHHSVAKLEYAVTSAWTEAIKGGNWQAARDFAERVYPDRYDKGRERQEHAICEVRIEGVEKKTLSIDAWTKKHVVEDTKELPKPEETAR